MKGGFGFCHLKPELLRGVDQALETNDGEAFKYIDSVFSSQDAYQVVVSHEMLCYRSELECAIVGRALEMHSFDHIVISGYSGCNPVILFLSYLNGILGPERSSILIWK